MKSVTKTKLTEGDIRRIVSHNFGGAEAESVAELKGGLFNTAYALSILGQTAVLKAGPLPSVYTLTYEKDIMKAETEVNGMLKRAGVPVAGIIAADFTRSIAPCDYFIMELARGRTWHKTSRRERKSVRPAFMRHFGECNARTHSIAGDRFGYIKDDPRFRFGSWYEAFSAMAGDILEDGKKLECKLPYAEISAVISANKRFLDDVRQPRLVNFDMWAGNVFADNGEITAIIDLERAFYGDPYADFTASMFIYSDIEKEPGFISGYESVTGERLRLGESERRRMDLYRLYMALIMHVETYRYGRAYAAMVKLYTNGIIKRLLKKLIT